MADKRFRNIVNGESVDAADGATYDLINPATGEVYAAAPASKAEDVDRAMKAADKAFETWGDTTPVGAAEGTAEDRRRPRVAGRGVREGRVRQHRQAARAHDERRDAYGDRPDPVLRRCGTGAGGQVRRRVHEGPHVLHPPRADRRRGPGDALELPADDDDLEDRSGARRRQHDRAQALRHHAGVDDAVRRDGAGVPAAGCLQRGVRRPRHRPRGRRAPVRRSWSRSRARCARASRSPGSAAKQLKRAHLELGGKAPVIVFDDADLEKAAAGIAAGRLLQRRAGLHGRDPRARWAGRCTRTSSRR